LIYICYYSTKPIDFINMNRFHHSLRVITLVLFALISWGQGSSTVTSSLNTPIAHPSGKQKVVVVTGARFAYPLLQQWIDNYNTVNQEVQVVIEARGSVDPANYDILIEAYEPTEEARKNREYIYIARYAVVPVANEKSSFAKTYHEKGLDKELIKQLFFHDIFADKENQKAIKEPYTTYTRLQKAGVPTTFAQHFGYEQKDIKGKGIAGSDEHLLKALLRDSTGVTYFPLTVAYDYTTGKPREGLRVLPVDLNGNKRVSADEKIVDNLHTVIQWLEEKSQKESNNVPLGYLHLSIDKQTAGASATAFLRWVISNGQDDLHSFGYLKPEPGRLEANNLDQLNPK